MRYDIQTIGKRLAGKWKQALVFFQKLARNGFAAKLTLEISPGNRTG
jgi:hypothetical protein